MNIQSHHNIKAIYRVTGTPENFLTALRFGVWGFNEGNKEKWENLNSGDIIFFHSKGTDSFFVKKSRPCVIGFGVVGNNFFIDITPLWIDEFHTNLRYPYKFAFSELYFFEDIPIDDTWDSTSLSKKENTAQLIKKIVESAIPLSELDGFPHMGSYSGIKNNSVKSYLLSSIRKLNVYKGIADEDIVTKSSGLIQISSADEALRHSTTLTVFDDINERIISKGTREYTVNTDMLCVAEKSHHSILSYLTGLLLQKGYTTLNNNHVDLFSYKKERALLIEAKSIENMNFRSQSRKGIVQLFEYNYFEVSKFKRDNSLSFSDESTILVTSDIPKDNEYIKFINSLNIKTAAVKDSTLSTYGLSLDFQSL